MNGRPQLYVVQDGELAARSDDDLMQLAKAGRRDAFEVLVARHTSLVIGTAARFLSDRQRAREVAQDVFLSLWSERDRYVAQDKLRAFLVAMTFNRCRVVSRRNKTEASKTERLAELDVRTGDEGTPLDALIEKSKAAEVRSALSKLPEPMREILILRYTHDLSLKEIADATHKPVGTIKSHVFRSLKKLREVLSKGAAE